MGLTRRKRTDSYTIDDVVNLKHLSFSAPQPVESLSDAFSLAKKDGKFPASLREMAAFRIAIDALTAETYPDGAMTVGMTSAGNITLDFPLSLNDAVEEGQYTHTVAIYFKEGEKFLCAYDDIPDWKKNVLLANHEECARREQKESAPLITLSRDRKDVRDTIERARSAGRVVHVVPSLEGRAIRLRVQKFDGVSSEYGKNAIIIAQLGDLSERYAQLLHTYCSKSLPHGKPGFGIVQALGSEELIQESLDEKTALIRPVACEGADCANFTVEIPFWAQGFAFSNPCVTLVSGHRGFYRWASNLFKLPSF